MSKEIQSQIQSQIETKIDDFVGDLGLPDVVKVGDQIEQSISNLKTDAMQINPVLQGRNAKTQWQQNFTFKQADTFLGMEGQKIMHQENEAAQTAADTSLDNAQNAQSDYVTQEVMKKMTTQNAQNAAILNQIHSSMQQHTQLTATTNLNLANISQHLAQERIRQQKEQQGSINAIYQNANFNDQFWNRSDQ